MELFNAPATQPSRLGILPGSFNPPTRAHLALAHAALDHVDQVLLVLPEAFPHKSYEGASFEQRLDMLRRLTAGEPYFMTGVSNGGLFIAIAQETREFYPDAQLFFLCGRDAAERIVEWDYGEAGVVERMLEAFHLLVAPRNGVYVPPAHVAASVHALSMEDYSDCSATAVREAIAKRGLWREMVPQEIADWVERIYSPADASRNARRR
jgi:nicotinate (nicotinamide) nucleotide adenylyltransferase